MIGSIRVFRTSAISICLTVLTFSGLAFSGFAQVPAKNSRQVAGEPVHYFDGARRIDLVLALDELQVGSPAGISTSVEAVRAASSGIRSAAAVAGAPGLVDVKLAPSSGRPGLEAQANAIRAAMPAVTVRAVLYPSTALDKPVAQRQVLEPRLSLKILPDRDVKDLANEFNLKVVEKVSFSPNTYILEVREDGLLASLDVANRICETEEVEFASPLLSRLRSKRLVPNDTLFGQQWHLRNTGSNASAAVAGNDVNITTAWDSWLGNGINIVVTDDGVQVAHPDLAANARTDIDIDINYGDNDPTPDVTGDDHGTAVAGVAAGRGNNSLGVSGAAPQAGIVGVRLISKPVTDSQEAQAMNHQVNPANAADRASINTNSWGPSDDGATLEAPGALTRAALQNATSVGRGGKGVIFTWAGGNGGSGDNANYDGYANSRYTIAVGASGASGEKSSYSEEGSCILVNAPSSYASGAITTTDRTGSAGYSTGDYATDFGGTSSACPLAAGCIALMLQANPNLTWRDVQTILANTSTKNSPTDAGWITNGVGRQFNHKFGFGRVNATAAVAAASTWVSLPAEATPLSATETATISIPDNNATGITRTRTLTAPAGFVTEQVEVTVNITHPYRGDLEMFLTSPAGTVSKIAATRGDSSDNYSGWTFSTVASWGENPSGAWTLKIADRFASDVGSLTSWTVKANGYIASQNGVSGWELLY